MSYLGNGFINEDKNSIFLNESTCKCLCCEEDFIPGYMNCEGNDVYSREFYEPPEKVCDCGLEDALKKELLLLDEYGDKLCDRLFATELEVHYFSVWLDKTFEEICELENIESLFAEWRESTVQGGCFEQGLS